MRAKGGPGLQEQERPGLLGRESECAAIDRLLEDVRAGARKVFTKLGITSRSELIRDGLPHRETG